MMLEEVHQIGKFLFEAIFIDSKSELYLPCEHSPTVYYYCFVYCLLALTHRRWGISCLTVRERRHPINLPSVIM